MGTVQYTDDAYTTMASTVGPTDTTINVTSSSRFAGVLATTGDFFFVTLRQTATGTKETVKVTNIVGTVWTVVRAVGPNDSNLSFASGDGVYLRLGTNLIDEIRSSSNQTKALFTTATGTVDVLTAILGITPQSLVDGMQVHLRTPGKNTSLTPTLNLNTLGAKTITKNNGSALAHGDLNGDALLRYVSSGARWELLNPKAGNVNWFSILAYGADPTGTTDSTAAIQACLNAASSARAVFYVPPGTYKLIPATAWQAEGGTDYCAISMVSNMAIIADPGATFRIADGVYSYPASRTPMEMFGTNQQLHDVTIIGLTMDMNGANNALDPSDGTSPNVDTFSQAHIKVSGGTDVVGHSAYIHDVYIERCRFINGPGTVCIGTSQTNHAGDTVGRRWTVKNNVFYNNGNYSQDHSTITGSGLNGLVVDGNTFYTDVLFGTSSFFGPRAAIEIHGRNSIFTNNIVQGYYFGAWVTASADGGENDILITNNVFNMVTGGGIFFQGPPVANGMANILIDGNTFELVDVGSLSGWATIKSIIEIADFGGSYGLTDIRITNNITTKNGTTIGSAFVNVSAQNISTQLHSRIFVEGNQVKNFGCGVVVGTNGAASLGDITVVNNDFIDLIPAGWTGVSGIPCCGVYANTRYVNNQTSINSITLVDNRTTDDRDTPLCNWGIYLDDCQAVGHVGTINNLTLRGNVSRRLVNGPYYENNIGSRLAILNRYGDHDRVVFTPNFLSSLVGITLGNGSMGATFWKEGAKVTVNAHLIVGSSTTFPTGNIQVGLPLIQDTGKVQIGSTGIYCTQSDLVASSCVGQWRIFNGVSPGTIASGMISIDDTRTTAQLELNGARFVTQAAPYTLQTTGVTLYVQFTYFIGLDN